MIEISKNSMDCLLIDMRNSLKDKTISKNKKILLLYNSILCMTFECNDNFTKNLRHEIHNMLSKGGLYKNV